MKEEESLQPSSLILAVLRDVYPLPLHHHLLDAADGGYVALDVAADGDEVGLEPRTKAPELLASVQEAGGGRGCRGYGFERRESAVHQQLQLPPGRFPALG